MSNFNDFTIIIPALNEKSNLTSLIPALANLYPGASIFISDDGSSDGTINFIKNFPEEKFPVFLFFLDRKRRIFISPEKKIKKNFTSVFFKENLPAGLCGSVIDAIFLIKTSKFAVMDADFQHPPSLPGDMYEKLSHWDLVCACRRSLKSMPLIRRIISVTGNTIARLSLPRRTRFIRDPLSGAFAARTGALKKLIENKYRFSPAGFKILFEILKTSPADLKICQCCYLFGKRDSGQSKIRFPTMLSFFNSLRFHIRALSILCAVIFILVTIYVALNLF